MRVFKKGTIALLLSLSLVATLALGACGAGQQVQQAAEEAISAVTNLTQGENVGEVGKEYATKWFTFTVETLEKTPSLPDVVASEGNILVVARITETNTSGSTQPFGTFDWFIDDDTLSTPIFPLDPVNEQMMPVSFNLADGESVTYDVVFEIPEDLAHPFLVYIEENDQGETFSTFKIPVN